MVMEFKNNQKLALASSRYEFVDENLNYLSDDVIVDSVKFDNGLLTISLRKIIPDHQAKKVYDIE